MNPNICGVCLSVDRKLTELNGDMLDICRSFLGQNDMVIGSLCWECAAICYKFVRFKRRAEAAQNILADYNTAPNSALSQLKQTETLQVACTEQRVAVISGDDDDEGGRVEVYRHTCGDGSSVADADDNNSDTSDGDRGLVINEVFLPRGSDEESSPDTSSDNKKTRKQSGARDRRQAGVVRSSSVLRKLRALNMSEDLLEMVILTWDEWLASDKFSQLLYKCYDCVLGFNHRFKLEEHRKKHDESWGPCVCDVCLVRCKNSSALSAHRAAHRSR
ncbi:unnamed protein product [Leptidea sinapis]|uniref:C2H2-type domain-containing protein n=2 Tax=Leptidea sinapis TaxID=189913 RepID=A0A5E4Q908_9NEOP|nr:unnamed protein product [Leptidea sinapis]